MLSTRIGVFHGEAPTPALVALIALGKIQHARGCTIGRHD